KEPNWKMQLSSVRQAVRLGADAVSVRINVGSEHEQNMLDQFSRILDECDEYGIPTLGMMYPRGPGITNEHDQEVVSHAARLGYEIGADIVKTNYTGNVDGFRDIVRAVKVPVVVAGGPKTKTVADAIRLVAESIEAGASGVSIGRNVFQHRNPTKMTEALARIVHDNTGATQALSLLGENK
ncbi:MAG TPA: 2-amino-3,7-dideoxy-D-threo-hept-6-ulosonate synthase, partial [Candidatus Bathyarchaeia archaeon]|nr:2-amino-3,7-dideoxy-D-threo-hept-6-ulosonate synthase [Candidatus Bathyarchaeia archaeon]